MRYLLIVGLLLLLAFSACVQHAGTTATPIPVGTSENQAETAFAEARNKMVEEQIRGRDIINPRVLSAMAKVPRHQFVPPEYLNEAYADHPLPIGYGQTISQPYIVALMTQHLAIRPGEKVLEIGTGSGYQAAILAEITDQVYTIEIIEPLGQRAATTLKKLGYNVHCKISDGYYGWEENAPFDAIIVTCAPDHVPQLLLKQLKDGGKLVIPVGPPGYYQTLWLIEKKGEQFQSTNLGDVVFVPMLGEH
jgi:protein-L-isoaspartate(D-aspartate) O-methyltransferase